MRQILGERTWQYNAEGIGAIKAPASCLRHAVSNEKNLRLVVGEDDGGGEGGDEGEGGEHLVA